MGAQHLDDRRVHARHVAGHEIVRYDRQGHWYVERKIPDVVELDRERVAVPRAAMISLDVGWEHLRDVPGGSAFDRVRDQLVLSQQEA